MNPLSLNTIKEQSDKINKSASFRIQYFRYGYKAGREINIDLSKYTLRIAQHQLALWKDYKPIFNLLF